MSHWPTIGQQVHRHLERRQLRLLADLLGGDLIDGRAEVVVGALGQLGPGRAQEGGVGGRVRAGVGVPQLQVRDRRDVLLDRRQRAQDRRQLVERRPPGGVQRVTSQPIGM